MWQINHCRFFNAKSSLYIYIIYIYMIWIGWFLWHINHCWLFNVKSPLYIYIRYTWFCSVGFYGISTIVGYLKPNPLYTYISNIYDLDWLDLYGKSTIAGFLMPNPLYTHILYIYMIWIGWFLWHINHCWLFNAKSPSYIYIRYTWFCSVGFYGISTIVDYLMPNPLYTYISNIYDLVWLGFMAYQPL